MKKQIILSSLFFVASLFLSSVQAANLDDLDICPNPNSSDNRVLEEGYTCKVSTVETRLDSDEGYKDDEDCKDHQGVCYVQWTLVNKEGDKETWAAHAGRWGWGLIYVGDVEDGVYTFSDAEKVCKNKEIVINGKRIKMTLPEIGFGLGGSDIERPLNFEFLKHLNYTSVVSNRDQSWFWSLSSSLNRDILAWVFRPDRRGFHYNRYGHNSVRCVGR